MLFLDTHALLWWTLDPQKLSSKAQLYCERMERNKGYVSSISIWEIGIKIKRGRLDIGISIEQYVDRLGELDCLEIVPVSSEIWIKNLSLDWEHRDPADRTIVASALSFNLPLVTKDEVIQSFISNQVIW